MKRSLLLLLFLFAFAISFSQDQDKPKPKIGLVLSGGGAKGFAHIGVLKVLDEAGVKISYIGGTSMGAVVGGLYASGYSAHQIDSIFKATDFDALVNDFIPRASKNFYEKRNDELYAFTLPFHKFKVGIPMSLSKGLYNYNLLTKLTHNVRHIRDFNQLPIPFICMATDIETGQEVLINKGFLSQALLASSAFPTLFSPVEMDGRLLIDGGVRNNYPIEEVRKMGADIIIGVDVQDDLRGRKDLIDVTKILVQISNIQMNEKTKQKIANTDIYIKPKLHGYGVIDFDKLEKIVELGEDAAFSVYEKLKRLGDKPSFNAERGVKVKKDSLKIDIINVNKLENHNRAFVYGKLGFTPGKKISYADLTKGIDNLSATQNFSTIGYTLDPLHSGDALNLSLKENPIRNFLKFALHYDDVYKSGILVNLTRKNTFFKNDVTSVDLVLGDNYRFNFDYYIDNGFYWSFGFKSRLNKSNKNIPTDFREGQTLSQLGLTSLNVDYADFTNQAYLQSVFFKKFLMGAGVEYKYLKIQSNTIESVLPIIENSDYLGAYAYTKYDSFDNKYFPKRGWFFEGDFHSYLYSSNYTGQFNPFSIAKGEIGFATTFFKKLSFKAQSEAGFSIGQKSVPYFDFMLGGYGYNPFNNFRHFLGYEFSSLVGDSYIKSAFTLDYEFYKRNHFNFIANFANIQDNLFKTTTWILDAKYKGYAVGYGLETLIGPIEVKYTWSPDHVKGFTWVTVGFWF